MADVCGTVKCAAAATSFPFLSIDALSSFSERSLLGSFGSFGVGLNRTGCAIWASRVSNGNNPAFGSPVIPHHY